jgi:Zn ribbon nucleic-acid-binding protein
MSKWSEVYDALIREGYSEERAAKITNSQVGSCKTCPFCKDDDTAQVSNDNQAEFYECHKCGQRFGDETAKVMVGGSQPMNEEIPQDRNEDARNL